MTQPTYAIACYDPTPEGMKVTGYVPAVLGGIRSFTTLKEAEQEAKRLNALPYASARVFSVAVHPSYEG